MTEIEPQPPTGFEWQLWQFDLLKIGPRPLALPNGVTYETRPAVQRAMRAMPPLLKTYLLMGGWVSDHAVVDRNLNTLHVFTGLEIRAIPPARARLLRLAAG